MPLTERSDTERARALLDEEGREADALAIANRCHERSGGTDAHTWLLLAEVYFALDRDHRARNSARCARLFAKRGSGVEADALMWEAKALVSEGDARQAVARASDAIEIDPTLAERYEVLARALALIDRWGEAMSVVAAGRIAFPKDENLEELEDVVFEGLAEVEGSVATAERAVRKSPKKWQLHHELAVLQLCAGRLHDAAESFDMARSLHPDALSPVTMLSVWEADCRLAVLSAT